jgi:hypothetical protein
MENFVFRKVLESFGAGEVLGGGWCLECVCDEAGKKWRLRSGVVWLRCGYQCREAFSTMLKASRLPDLRSIQTPVQHPPPSYQKTLTNGNTQSTQP